MLAPIPVIALGVLMEVLFLRPLYRRGHMDQVLLTFGFTFVFLDLVQTVWGRTVLRLPAPDGAARHSCISGLACSPLSAVSDRLRLRHRVAAVAVSGPQPDRRHGAGRRR